MRWAEAATVVGTVRRAASSTWRRITRPDPWAAAARSSSPANPTGARWAHARHPVVVAEGPDEAAHGVESASLPAPSIRSEARCRRLRVPVGHDLGGLGLHDDAGDVVCHQVVQLPGQLQPLVAGRSRRPPPAVVEGLEVDAGAEAGAVEARRRGRGAGGPGRPSATTASRARRLRRRRPQRWRKGRELAHQRRDHGGQGGDRRRPGTHARARPWVRRRKSSPTMMASTAA